MDSEDCVEQSSIDTAEGDGATLLHSLSPDRHSDISTEALSSNMNVLSKPGTQDAQLVYLKYKDGKVEFKVLTHWAFLANQVLLI
jgi:hypothetical protein